MSTVNQLLDTLHSLEVEFQRAATDTRHCGSGSWWELDGYARILNDAQARITHHRIRVIRQDRAIERERATVPVDAGLGADGEELTR